MQTTTQTYTRTTPIETVRNDPVFGDYGRLIFPVERSYYSGDTLEQLHHTYYNNIDPDETVDICNTLRQRAADGQTIFYDIYTEDEKAADPDKADTGLFYFKGNPGAKFSICNAGGAFAYVGAMQDSFPHALELSRKEYNAFALIYRPGAQTACEDLARAIAFVFTHAEELEVDTSGYSLWGGSAGAVDERKSVVLLAGKFGVLSLKMLYRFGKLVCQHCALDGSNSQVVAVLGAFGGQFAQHHFRAVYKIAVDGKAIFRLAELYPVRFMVDGAVTLLQKNNVRNNIGTSIGAERIVWQTDSPQQISSLCNVLAGRRIFAVQRVATGDECHDAARTHLVDGLGEEIVVDAET